MGGRCGRRHVVPGKVRAKTEPTVKPIGKLPFMSLATILPINLSVG